MRKIYTLLLLVAAIAIGSTADVVAQERATISGTIVSYGSGFNTRVTTDTFRLNLRSTTPAADIDRYLQILDNDGQDELLDAIRGNDLGNFSIGNRVGVRVNAASIADVGGMQRVRIVFQRWLEPAEVRNGYRSVDHPFGYMELMIDPRTGRGDGTYIAAARIRMKNDKRTGNRIVEVEDFATFPSKVMGVSVRGKLFK